MKITQALTKEEVRHNARKGLGADWLPRPLEKLVCTAKPASARKYSNTKLKSREMKLKTMGMTVIVKEGASCGSTIVEGRLEMEELASTSQQISRSKPVSIPTNNYWLGHQDPALDGSCDKFQRNAIPALEEPTV